MRLQFIICHKKELVSSLFCYKTRANTQQVLPVKIGLYWCNKWKMHDINNKSLTEVNKT